MLNAITPKLLVVAVIGWETFVPPRPTLKGPAAAMDRDVTCWVPGYMDGVEKAHLVPEGERLWFVSNRMDNVQSTLVKDDNPIVTLLCTCIADDKRKKKLQLLRQ